MKLYIDIGNSRVRMAVEATGLEPVTAFHYDADTLAAVFDSHCAGLPPPERVLVANVAGDKVAAIVTSVCRSRWSIMPEFPRATANAAGITNAYTSPAQLGIDRWLAIIAAWNKYRDNLFVFGCGSAVTADRVAADGTHQGGYIMPGTYMMQQALATTTGQIALTGPYRFSGRPGRSTDECVYNGTTYAVAAFIEFLLQQVNTPADSYRCIISGGGAEGVQDILRVPFHYEPLLVIEGLRIMGEC